MASSRKIPTNENVSSYNSGGGADYSLLDNWEGDTDIDLVTATQGETLEVEAGNHDDETVLSGVTADSSYWRCIRPAAGAKHIGVPDHGGSVAAFVSTTDPFSILRIAEDYTQVQDLCVDYAANSGSSRQALSGGGGTNYGFIGMLARCINSGGDVGRGARISVGGGDLQFYINCLFYECDDYGIRTDEDSFVYNCTAYGCDTGFLGQSTNELFINCLADGNISNDFDGTMSGSSDYNASGDATAPGTNSRINQTFTFKATGSDDYRLGINDAGALDFGTNLSADASYPFDDDAKGRLRVAAWTWDIGMDEYFSPYPIVSDIESRSLVFGNRIVR